MTDPAAPFPPPPTLVEAPAEDAPSPFLVALLAWLIPGAGHFYIGLTGKGAIFFVGIMGLIVFGSALGEWRTIMFPDGKSSESPWVDNLWFLIQLGSGLTTLLFGILNRGQEPIVATIQPLEVAFLYCRVAGMLNILLVIDAFTRAEAMNMPTLLRPTEPAAGPQVPPPTPGAPADKTGA